MGKYRCDIFEKPCPRYLWQKTGGTGPFEALPSCRVLLWLLIPSALLLTISLLVYFSIDSSDEGLLLTRHNKSTDDHVASNLHVITLETEDISLDETRVTYHIPIRHSEENMTKKEDIERFQVVPEGAFEVMEEEPESLEEEDDFDTSESKPATLANRRLITSNPYMHMSTTLRTSGIQVGGKSFVDKLISRFDQSAKAHQRTLASQTMDRARVMPGHLFTNTRGLLNKKLPSHQISGDHQMVPTQEVITLPPLRVSPTLPSSSPTVHLVTLTKQRNETESTCSSPRLSLCRGVLPWDLTATPAIPGITTPFDLDAVMPYFEMISSTGCSSRIRQFLCSLLEPECRMVGHSILPPCRKACRVVEEECRDFILDSLDLSQVFNCDSYPDSSSDEECVNLAKGGKCLKHEFQCSGGTCIPWRWACDGVRDCQFGDDESNCTKCGQGEFRCSADHKCVPLEWKCDKRKDCSDGSDELNCKVAEVLMQHSHTSPCPSGELRCVDGRCITIQQICDTVNDCTDGADEANCGPPST